MVFYFILHRFLHHLHGLCNVIMVKIHKAISISGSKIKTKTCVSYNTIFLLGILKYAFIYKEICLERSSRGVELFPWSGWDYRWLFIVYYFALTLF